ncbi:MAG TPA: PspC domain-containing protein [Actinomycetota bacterium]
MDEQPSPTPPAPPDRPPLRRSRSDRVIGGVAGGIAQHLGLDATLIRLAWVAVALLGGGGILLYLIAWLIIAEEPAQQAPGAPPPTPPPARDGTVAAYIIGGILIALGAVSLIGPVTVAVFRFLIPAILIAVGVAIIANSSRR